MARNRIFFPQEALDGWLFDNRVELANDELTIRAEGRKYRIIEAARVLRELTGLPDAYDLIGRVKTAAFLGELGAELLEGSMLVGDNAYDVVRGFLATPVGTLADHLKKDTEARLSRPDAPPPPATDEELLGRFLLKAL